jgi:PKD repeat protein
VSVEHAYDEPGTYTITLTITNDDGETDTFIDEIYITGTPSTNISPVASFTQSTQTTSIGESINFDASSSHDPDGFIETYLWDFGDGKSEIGMNINHTYKNIGVYTITLTVMDNNSGTDISTSSITITETISIPPAAILTKSEETTIPGIIIIFDGSESYDYDGSIVNYLWDFGDGTTASGVSVEHAYDEPGTYAITLTVTDNDDLVSSTTSEIIIQTETTISLAVLSGIGVGITALTALLLVILLIRGKKRKNQKSKRL